MQSTLLSTIISRMDRWKTLYDTAEADKVKDIDSSLRTYKRKYKFPWNLKKGSLRVFGDVLEYPMASDHDALAYLENPDTDSLNGSTFRGVYNSIKQFYENPNDRNDIAEIWDSGEKYLGVRNDNIGLASYLVDSADDSDKYSYSEDITSIGEDTVIFKEGSKSLRVNITNNSDMAVLTGSPTSVNDANYKQKYFFVWVYLDSLPDSIDMKFGNDISNYLYKNVTTQFAGQPLKADQWNLIAFDLNVASVEGSIDSTVFDFFQITFNGAASGIYYIDASYLRRWMLMDYWYYSDRTVKLTGESVATQKFFHNDSQVYSDDSFLVCDDDFVDLIMYEAMLLAINEKENPATYGQISQLRDDAWEAITDNYPSLEPYITDTYYNFDERI